MSILELHHVVKRFGQQQVLKDVNFEVPTGSIFGFVGENGAGKTTTMKLILGLETIDAGEIRVNGQNVQFGVGASNHLIGYLPDVPEFYGYMTAAEYLQLCGQLTGIAKTELPAKITTMLTKVGLATDRHKIGGYSRGMKQRLGIAQALLNDPELLICDEPTSALDPAGRREFLTLLASLRGQVTIIFSTHILTDVERICDQVGILHDGEIKAQGTLPELKQQYATKQISFTFGTAAEMTAASYRFDLLQQQNPAIQQIDCDLQTKSILVGYKGDYAVVAQSILVDLLGQKLVPESMARKEPTLEQIFMEVIK